MRCRQRCFRPSSHSSTSSLARSRRVVSTSGLPRFARGRPVTSNAELVERAAALAELAQRPPMRPDQARALLGVNGRR